MKNKKVVAFFLFLFSIGQTEGFKQADLALVRSGKNSGNWQNLDLSGADLHGLIFKFATMTGTNFSGARLLDADMGGASLKGANFSKAQLSVVGDDGSISRKANLSGVGSLYGANFTEATLAGVDLSQASLQGANFTEANLQGANLLGARVQGTYFYKANLENANLQWINYTMTTGRGPYFYQANLQKADLSSANLKGAYLYGANLTGAKGLGSAKFDTTTVMPGGYYYNPSKPLTSQLPAGSSLSMGDAAMVSNSDDQNLLLNRASKVYTETDFSKIGWANGAYAQLAGAIIQMKGLQGANLTNAHLMKANLLGSDLSKANLTNANLNGASLQAVNFQGANLKGAILYNAILYDEHPSNVFNKSNFDGAQLDDSTIMPSGEPYDQSRDISEQVAIPQK